MRSFRTFMLAAIATLLLMMTGGEAAPAASLQFSAGNFTASFLTGSGGEELSPACVFTLNGTLARGSIEKVSGARLGSITRFTGGACNGAREITALGLPWSITYESILGTLPSGLTAILVALTGFAVLLNTNMFGSCLYTGSPGFLWGIIVGSNPYATGLLMSLQTSLRKLTGLFCNERTAITGTLSLRGAQTIVRL